MIVFHNDYSKIQARQAFSQYLQCVLVRITAKDTKAKIKNSVDDSDSELIMRFLQRANNNLRTQHQAKVYKKNLLLYFCTVYVVDYFFVWELKFCGI